MNFSVYSYSCVLGMAEQMAEATHVSVCSRGAHIQSEWDIQWERLQ